jgi:hypothetical protein
MPKVSVAIDVEEPVPAPLRQGNTHSDKHAAVPAQNQRRGTAIQQTPDPSRQPRRMVDQSLLIPDPTGGERSRPVIDIPAGKDHAGIGGSGCDEAVMQPHLTKRLRSLRAARNAVRNRRPQAEIGRGGEERDHQQPVLSSGSVPAEQRRAQPRWGDPADQRA